MSYKLTDNTGSLGESLNQKASLFLRMAAEAIVSTSTKKTPMKTGRLRMDVLKQVLGLKGSVVWGKNYAAYQEEKQFRNYSTPGTGPHFAEDAVRDVIGNTSTLLKQAGLT